MIEPTIHRTATFSPDRKYRYTLDIVWDATKPKAAFIGLNPSTADEVNDDPTVRRCCDFAKSWNCGGIRMLNLFAFRATDPKVMKAQDDPVGDENTLCDLVINIRDCSALVACWGTHGLHLLRGDAVRQILINLQCFGRNRDGTPKHPLYLRKDTRLEPFGMGKR